MALLTALGVERVLVRQPRVRVVRSGVSEIIRGAATLIASAIDGESGIAITGRHRSWECALNDDSADMVVAIGGTGSGRNDESVRTLARVGKVQFHGIGIAPGETTALGFVGTRPVLLLPGRIDAALAGWLTIGRRMLARRAFPPDRGAAVRRRSWRARSPRRWAWPKSSRCGAGSARSSRSRPDICRCRRWRTPRAGSWFRPTARAFQRDAGRRQSLAMKNWAPENWAEREMLPAPPDDL